MYSAETSTPLGRYRLIALLGQGGMADVYLACTQGPRGFQKLLVVKLARFTGDPVFSTMFLDEARIAAQLEHPNVIQTYEIAEEGSSHYIVMEYLDGGNLSRLRQRSSKSGGIPLRTSITILLQVLEGLEYAHEARGLDGRALKLVHRDLSPSNIMVTAQGAVKILDFGIAKAADSHSFTEAGKFSGKLGYMPPEQVRGTSVDARADIFAFGVILAEAAMNEKLWMRTTAAEIATKLATNEIPSLERGMPIDPMLHAICVRALAPDREDRYATAGELKADLAKYLEVLGGPMPTRDLAHFVRTTVEDDRTKLQAVVDAQLQKLSAEGARWGGPMQVPDLPRVEHTPSRDSTVLDEPPFEPIEILAVTSSSDPQAVAKPPPMPRPIKRLALGGVLVVFGIVFVLVLAMIKKPPDAVVMEPIPMPMASSPPPPAATTTVRLEIVASPANATLLLDGKPLVNPYVGAFPRDTKVHDLFVDAPGFATLTQQVAADRDLNLRVNLTPARATPPRPTVRPIVRPSMTTTPTHPAKGPTTPLARVEAKVEPQPVEQKKAKHGNLDTEVYSKTQPKRSLDLNVLDGSAKPTIDRDNPWQK